MYIFFGFVLVELLAPALVKGKSKTYKLTGGELNSNHFFTSCSDHVKLVPNIAKVYFTASLI